MAPRRSDWLFGALALGVHAILLGALSSVRPAARSTVPAPSSDVTVEFDTFAEPSPAAAPTLPEAAARLAALAPPTRNSEHEGRVAAPRTRAESGAPPATVLDRDAPDTPSDPLAEPVPEAPRLGLEELGLGETRRFQPPIAPHGDGRTRAERDAGRLDRSLAQGLADRERERGRASGGPIVGALQRAAQSGAPTDGSATLSFTVDASGRVVAAELFEASSHGEQWLRVAERARRALGKRRLRVPAGAQGLRVTVQIETRVSLPSGADPGLAVDVFGIPLSRGRGPRSTRVAILSPMKAPKPRPGEPEPVIPPLPVIPLIGLAGDPADIGAKARSVVHARIVGEELL